MIKQKKAGFRLPVNENETAEGILRQFFFVSLQSLFCLKYSITSILIPRKLNVICALGHTLVKNTFSYEF
jgi:hypothetical protein